ncbi:hypothetical protein [Photobacterium kishitanii]|nr:hypothetical protein [Photobacterium kishitanii]
MLTIVFLHQPNQLITFKATVVVLSIFQPCLAIIDERITSLPVKIVNY